MTEQFDDLKVDPEFLKGFNEAYLLSGVRADLAEIINSALPEGSERSNGFKSGYHQYNLDKGNIRQFKPSWAKSTFDRDKEMERDKDIDKDDLDIEKD